MACRRLREWIAPKEDSCASSYPYAQEWRPLSRGLAAAAVAAGHLRFLQGPLCNSVTTDTVSQLLYGAALHGHVKVTEWLSLRMDSRQVQQKTLRIVMEGAAHGGQIEVLRWVESAHGSDVLYCMPLAELPASFRF